ncbi:hypothetical protein RhiirA4_475140 [Rhizophagus irregularis]|uniref:Uncharacterized protein n=1 Tax=Rhizophagus irregularis TaxID=588596 RepID=A0A2I1H9N2_9GLOM|nr:hypothetical protein RhiirA4_475140 [Rhizophagus irregularis]
MHQEKNHILVQLFVGYCYYNGYGTKKNQELALNIKVANKNLPSGQLEIYIIICLEDIILELSKIFHIEFCVENIESENSKAFHWCQKAAEIQFRR